MASLPYLVRAGKVYAWNGVTETYSTGVDCQNLTGLGIDPQNDTDELKILGATEETLSVLTAIDLSLNYGGIDWASMSVMTGTLDESSGGDTHINQDEGGTDKPYWGFGVALPLKYGREMHIYFAKCQLMQDIPIDVAEQTPEFVTPAIDAKAMRLRLADGTTFPIRYIVEKAAETALATDISTVIGLS